MKLDKYSRLKIASNILDFTIKDFAEDHNTSTQVIRDVAMGHSTSARLSEAIDSKIAEAEEAYQKHYSEKLARTE